MNLHYRLLALEQPEAPEDASSDDSSGRELSDSELELSGPNRNHVTTRIFLRHVPRMSGRTPDVQLRAIDVTLCIIGHLAPNLGECPDVFLFVTTQIFL